MTDNTIRPASKTLTSELLRQVLDQWCEEQPGVIWFEDDPDSEPGWLAAVWSPKCDIQPEGQGAKTHSEFVASLLGNGGAIMFDVKDWSVLCWIAIEHQYIPWLELVATLPYTGAKAARLTLRAIEKGLVETEPVEEPTPLGSVLSRVQRDLGGRVAIEGVGEE